MASKCPRPPVTHLPLFCSLGEAGGAGAEPPQNLPATTAVVQTVLPLKWSGRKRGQDCQILFPVFGGEMATAKIQTVKGAERRFFAKQKILLGLDGLDRRNGHDRRLLAAEKSAILGEANKEEVFEETQ